MMTSECAEEEDEKVKDIGLSERFDFIIGCISFLEQMAPNTIEEDIELCFTKLEYLWRVNIMLARRQACEF